VLLEHTLAHLGRIELLVRREIWRTRLERGQRGDDEYRGLYVSDADVDALLDPPGSPQIPTSTPDWGSAFAIVEEQIARLEEQAEEHRESLPLDRLSRLFGLSPFERDVLLVCLAVELDLRYERLYAYLQDDVTKKRPTVDLVLRLLGSSMESRLAQRQAFEPSAPLLRWDLVTLHDDPGARRPVLLARYLKLDDRIAAFLIGATSIDSRLFPWYPPSPSKDGEPLAARVERQLARWSRQWKWHAAEFPPVVLLHGRYGNGQLSAARAIADTIGRGLLVLDVSGATGGVDTQVSQRLRLAEREALLSNSLLCWSGVDGLLHADPATELEQRAFLRALASSAVPTVLLSERTWEPARALGDRPFLRLELGDTSYAERRELWATSLNGANHLANDDLAALAGRYRLSPGQIKDAISRARTR